MRRRLVFFALIVLMALRGLVGPAMAAQMAGMPHAGSAVSAHAEHGAHGADANSAAVEDEWAQHDHGTATGDHAAHAACADCEICHTVVMAPPAPAPGAASHGAGPRVPAAVRFASALPAQATKPPIS
jgi:hypothetical protein